MVQWAARNRRASFLRNFWSSEKSKFIAPSTVSAWTDPAGPSFVLVREDSGLSRQGKIDRASMISGFYTAVRERLFEAAPMAKAVFQRNQKVWVESVGAWAVIEKIVPIWAKGF